MNNDEIVQEFCNIIDPNVYDERAPLEVNIRNIISRLEYLQSCLLLSEDENE